MKRKRIGVDIDGVLADFTGSARKFFKQNYGKPDDSLIQTEWDFTCLGISDAEATALWDHIYTTNDWWTGLDPLPGAYKLGWLAKKHLVYFLTNRPEKTTGLSIEDQTKKWLYMTHSIEETNVIVTKNKGILATALDLDYFIDDNIPNVQDIIDKSPTTLTFIKDMPYNADFGGAPRLANLNELVDLVEAAEEINV